jgi:hypothetical protein
MKNIAIKDKKMCAKRYVLKNVMPTFLKGGEEGWRRN